MLTDLSYIKKHNEYHNKRSKTREKIRAVLDKKYPRFAIRGEKFKVLQENAKPVAVLRELLRLGELRKQIFDDTEKINYDKMLTQEVFGNEPEIIQILKLINYEKINLKDIKKLYMIAKIDLATDSIPT